MTPARLGVWPPLPPGVWARRPSAELAFPLEQAGCSLFSRARHGLWQGVQALGLRAGDEVLVPAYHHGSEVEALRCAGLVCRFYDCGAALEPDASELDSLLGGRVRALHLTHYLGFPQAAARWRTWCDERDLLLLEDAAQGWLSMEDVRPVGSLGDLAIFCLYKTFGVPDGGALLVRAAPPGPEAAQPLGATQVARRHAAWLVSRSGRLSDVTGRMREPSEYSSAEDFALGDPGSAPTSATRFLLPRLTADVAARRRANYRMLLEELGDRVPAPFSTLPAGASPFAFPVEVDRKSSFLERLEERGVTALDFWSVPHPLLEHDRFPAAASRRARTVAMPVHQELTPGDVERIAAAARSGRPRRPALRFEFVDSLEALRDEWTDLAEQTDNVFATWEWASIWWKHFGGGRPLAVAACRSADGRLRAILPLYVFSRRPVRIVRFIGHGPADQLGPICAPVDRERAAHALRSVLGRVRPDVFLAEQLLKSEGWSARLGGRVLRSEASPVLQFEGVSWDELLSSRSANLRQQIRRLERKLARENDLRYRLTDDPSALDEDLDTLFALHSARWSTSDFASAHNAFHWEFARHAFERGWLRLWFLEADGRTVAAWHGFRFGEVESYYQAGRDPAWKVQSVGLVLLAHSIRAALEDGMREYRFLRGGERFKFRFATEDPGLETIGWGRGPLVGAALAASGALPAPIVLALRRRLIG